MKFKIKKQRKSFAKKLAMKTINELFDFGFNYRGCCEEEVWKKVGKLIWKIKLSYRLKLPLNIKRFICRKCNTLLIPNRTLRVRNYNHHMEYKCLNCGFTRRFRLK